MDMIWPSLAPYNRRLRATAELLITWSAHRHPIFPFLSPRFEVMETAEVVEYLYPKMDGSWMVNWCWI